MECTFNEFKARCKELIDAADTLDDEQFANGVKCLNISYLNVTGTDLDLYQASIALKLTLVRINALMRVPA